MTERDAPSTSNRTRRIALLVAGLSVLGALVGGWLYLPGLVAQRTLGLLAGIACDPVDITVTPDLSHASIARTTCTVPAGPIASIALSSGAEVELRELRPQTIDVPMLAVNPRAIEMTGAATAVLVTGDTPDPLRRALVALASAAARTDLPRRVHVGEIDVGRGEGVVVAQELVVAHGASTFDVTLQTIGPPAHHGGMIDWDLAVNDVEVHATPETAIVTGHFDLHATVLTLPIERSIAFRLTGRALDGDAADYELWIEPSAELTWLREHAQAILDEIQAAGGVREALHERREQRIEARDDRVHELRERLDQRIDQLRGSPPPPPSP